MNAGFAISISTFSLLIICFFAILFIQETNGTTKSAKNMFIGFYISTLSLMLFTALSSFKENAILEVMTNLSVALLHIFLAIGFSRRYLSKSPNTIIISVCFSYFVFDTINYIAGAMPGYILAFLISLYCSTTIYFYDKKNKADLALIIVMVIWTSFTLFISLSYKIDFSNFYSDQMVDLFVFLPAYICGLTVFILSSYLIDAKNALYIQATTDSMTGLFNRRYLFEQASSLLKIADRTQLPMSTIMCDIDKFKLINDSYGHDFGDKVIVSFSETLKCYTRDSDIVARVGGEEFVILLIKTDINGAIKLAEKLRMATENLSLTIDNKDISFTASFGVADVDTKSPLEVSIKNADSALYQAKETGRNKACSFKSIDEKSTSKLTTQFSSG